jgi:hypothetical protein
MTDNPASPFARPSPGLRIKKGGPPLRRPGPEEVAAFPERARELVEDTRALQASCLDRGTYHLEWVGGRHFLLVGGTGSGLGGALTSAVLEAVGDSGSLTVIARDLKRSVGYQAALIMKERAEQAGLGKRFQWLNTGAALEGERFGQILGALKEAGADRVVYVNTVAAAMSGLLPGYPPVYVKDVDEDGLFEWELTPLDERSIEATKHTMGTMAVELPNALEAAGIGIEAAAFADWRGSVDRSSRDPVSPDYGRQGAYSTSLYLPKEIIQAETSSAYRSGKPFADFFLPVMKTQALSMVPGGMAMARLYETLMGKEGVRIIPPPELALGMLDRIGRVLQGEDDNPFPRLDLHEASLDLWFLEVVTRLNEDKDSDFHFERWIRPKR